MPNETTALNPLEEALYQKWAQTNAPDQNYPDAHYDYRGFWKEHPDFQRGPGQHLPDQFKQHGHPTFSSSGIDADGTVLQGSKYSKGPFDGGMWIGDTFLPQPKMAVAHKQPFDLGTFLQGLWGNK